MVHSLLCSVFPEPDKCLAGGAWGICVNNRANALVSGCNVHDNKGTGVNVYGGASMTLTESEVSFNRGRGVSISDQVCSPNS